MAGIKLEKERTKGIVKFCIKNEGGFSAENFVDGFDWGITTSLKLLKDKRNKYNSWLEQEQVFKLGKTANFERITSYKAYVRILDELIKDFEYAK